MRGPFVGRRMSLPGAQIGQRATAPDSSKLLSDG